MNKARILLGTFIVLIGFSLLFHFPFLQVFLALIVILFGLSIITKSGDSMFGNINKTRSSENYIKRVLIFSGINKTYESEDFQGIEIVAIFGGGELDLSKAKTKQKEIKMEFVTIFGGLKVTLPKDWKVETNGIGVLGGFDNKISSSTKTSTTAKIDGAAIFGGVEIVN